MYRHVTFSFTDLPVPMVEVTKKAPVRVVGHPLKRERDAPFAQAYLFLARGPQEALDEVGRILSGEGESAPRLDCAEPGARIYQGSLGLPSSGRFKGLLSVLQEALGTVLVHEPLVIEEGVLDLRLVTVPSRDSALRLRAIEQHAAEAGLGLRIPERIALTAPPVSAPRGEVLGLLEWEVLQALEATGQYMEDPESDRGAVVKELAGALGIPEAELDALAAKAERRLLREAVRSWRLNIRLATPPAVRPRRTAGSDDDREEV